MKKLVKQKQNEIHPSSGCLKNHINWVLACSSIFWNLYWILLNGFSKQWPLHVIWLTFHFYISSRWIPRVQWSEHLTIDTSRFSIRWYKYHGFLYRGVLYNASVHLTLFTYPLVIFHWKWRFRVDLPIDSMVIVHSNVNVYQRVHLHWWYKSSLQRNSSSWRTQVTRSPHIEVAGGKQILRWGTTPRWDRGFLKWCHCWGLMIFSWFGWFVHDLDCEWCLMIFNDGWWLLMMMCAVFCWFGDRFVHLDCSADLFLSCTAPGRCLREGRISNL